jgi:hypothetical protein
MLNRKTILVHIYFENTILASDLYPESAQAAEVPFLSFHGGIV